MPRNKPPFDLGLIPTVPEDGVQILDEQPEVPDDLSVITAQNVRVLDPENDLMDDDIPIAPLAEQHMISANQTRESRGVADTAIISGVFTTIGAVLGAAVGDAVETSERIGDPDEYKSQEFKDDVQDSSLKYGAVGAGVGGALGLMTSLILSRCVADFGDFNQHIRNSVSDSIRESRQAMQEGFQEMREGWQHLRDTFSGNRTQEAPEAPQPDAQDGDIELGQTQITGQPGAFASSSREHSGLPQGYRQRQDISELKEALARRSERRNNQESGAEIENNESVASEPAAAKSTKIEEYDAYASVARMPSPMEIDDDDRSTYSNYSDDLERQINRTDLRKPPPGAPLEGFYEEESYPEIEHDDSSSDKKPAAKETKKTKEQKSPVKEIIIKTEDDDKNINSNKPDNRKAPPAASLESSNEEAKASEHSSDEDFSVTSSESSHSRRNDSNQQQSSEESSFFTEHSSDEDFSVTSSELSKKEVKQQQSTPENSVASGQSSKWDSGDDFSVSSKESSKSSSKEAIQQQDTPENSVTSGQSSERDSDDASSVGSSESTKWRDSHGKKPTGGDKQR